MPSNWLPSWFMLFTIWIVRKMDFFYAIIHLIFLICIVVEIAVLIVVLLPMVIVVLLHVVLVFAVHDMDS